MKLDILFLVYIGYFTHVSYAKGHEQDLHIKVHVPDLVHQHNHKHTIYKKSPEKHNGKYEGQFVAGHGGEKANILVNDYSRPHDHEHGYKHEHKPYNKHSAKQKQNEKHKHENKDDDDDFKKYLDNFKVNPDKVNDHDYFNIGPVFKKTGKSVHTEHYEVKKINPDAKYPDEKYIIKGSYKVQDTDPFFGFTTTSVHAYDDPISKIAAQILTNYDYTNFDPHSGEKETADFLDSGEKEEQRDASLEDYERDNYSNDERNYDKYGAKKEKVNDYRITYPSHGRYDDNSAKKQKVHDYNNVYPNHEKYENIDAEKGKIHVYSTAYPSHGKYENYGGKEENINAYSNINPSQEKYNNAKNEKTKNIQDHSNSFPSQRKNTNYDVTAEIFNDYTNVHPNTEKSANYATKKTETPDYIVHPNYEKIINEPNYNYGGKQFDYFVNPNHGEVESIPSVYDYHPGYYGHKELDYFVNPNHDYLYGNDWQDYIMRTVYGNDYAASNQFASTILPEKSKKEK